MIILDEVVHINPFSELVNSIEKDGPISIIDIGNKLKKLKITWTEDNLRQLATNNRITSKRKFMVLETLTQNDDLWE